MSEALAIVIAALTGAIAGVVAHFLGKKHTRELEARCLKQKYYNEYITSIALGGSKNDQAFQQLLFVASTQVIVEMHNMLKEQTGERAAKLIAAIRTDLFGEKKINEGLPTAIPFLVNQQSTAEVILTGMIQALEDGATREEIIQTLHNWQKK